MRASRKASTKSAAKSSKNAALDLKRNNAAIKIQGYYIYVYIYNIHFNILIIIIIIIGIIRRFLAKCKVSKISRRTWQRVFDPRFKIYFFFNKLNGQSQWNLPVLLLLLSLLLVV